MINSCLCRDGSQCNFNEVTKEFPGWNGSLNKDGFVSREECRKVELNFVGISDEIPIKLAKLDTAVKTYKRRKNLWRTLNDSLQYDSNLDKYVEKRKAQEFKTFYITFILYDLSEQDTLIDQSIKPTETIRVITKLEFRKYHW